MRLTRAALVIALFGLVWGGCQKTELPLCGDPIFGFQVNYEVVDAATGQDWFVGTGRTSGDSLRLLPSNNGFGIAQQATRHGATYRLGPATVVDQGQGTATQLLRFSVHDVDTVVINFRYGPVQKGPCGEYKPVQEVEITYNGRPNGIFQASVPTDSLRDYSLMKVVQLRKHP